MYQKSREKSELILKLYNEGVILTKICELTSSSQQTVKKVLSFFEIDYVAAEAERYQEKLKQVIELYEQGKPQIYIEQTLGLTRKTIRNLLKTKEVKYKTKSDQWRLRWGSVLNENCFDVLTPDALYWVGFLYADGHVRQLGKEVGIELGIHSNDVKHVEKYREFLGCNKTIDFPKNKDIARLRVYSKRMYDRLRELGFDSAKSYTAKPHPDLKWSRDFWRGAVDGDGGVYNRKDTPQMMLCGTLETVFDFIIFCSKEAGIKDKYPSKAEGLGHYQVHYYGQDMVKVIQVLYKDSTTYLDRKYATYLEILKRYNIIY